MAICPSIRASGAPKHLLADALGIRSCGASYPQGCASTTEALSARTRGRGGEGEKEEDSLGLMRLLKRGELDLALASPTGIEVTKGIVAEPLLEEDLVLVVAPGHRLPGGAEIRRAGRAERRAVRALPAGVRDAQPRGRSLPAVGLRPDRGLRGRRGACLGRGGRGRRRRAHSDGRARGLRIRVLGLHPPLKREVAFFRNGDRYLSPAVRALMEFGEQRLRSDGR